MSGHGCMPDGTGVCACDQDPTRCPCQCYGCRLRDADVRWRALLGRWYRPACVVGGVVVRVLGWLR